MSQFKFGPDKHGQVRGKYKNPREGGFAPKRIVAPKPRLLQNSRLLHNSVSVVMSGVHPDQQHDIL